MDNLKKEERPVSKATTGYEEWQSWDEDAEHGEGNWKTYDQVWYGRRFMQRSKEKYFEEPAEHEKRGERTDKTNSDKDWYGNTCEYGKA